MESFIFLLSNLFFYFALKFLTIVTHLIYRILTLFGTIVCDKILFKFEDSKKQTFFRKNKKTLFKKKTLVFQIDIIN